MVENTRSLILTSCIINHSIHGNNWHGKAVTNTTSMLLTAYSCIDQMAAVFNTEHGKRAMGSATPLICIPSALFTVVSVATMSKVKMENATSVILTVCMYI